MRSKRARFSSGERFLKGLSLPGCVRVPKFPDLLCTEIVHIRFPLPDQPERILVELREIVRGVVLSISPVKTQPMDIGLDRIHVFDFLLAGIRVVEAQIAKALKFQGEAEVKADRLGVTDVEVTVGFGRKASVNPASVFVRLQVFGDDRLDEIGGRGKINTRHEIDTPSYFESSS
jgi:hypothetical protein